MGPLQGVKVVEIAGIGPGPFCAMMLADMGADVVRVDRAQQVPASMSGDPSLDLLNRGRRSIGVDLKNPDGVETVLRLAERAGALIEGFRPGVAERLGIGPDECLARNPRLVYGRMTGWGQEGPLAHAAGHDLNYVALAGALAHFGRAGAPPAPPLNLVGDFGGGGMFLAFGVVCGILEAARSGQGQVIDAAMVDGAAVLMTMIHGLRHLGMWQDERGTNLLDTGAHFYDAYETADGRWVAVGALEPQFYEELKRLTGLEDDGDRMDRARWPEYRERLADIFAQKTRDEWAEVLEGTDACFAPVLTMDEAARHPHNATRGTFVEVEGVLQPGPAPRFSRTRPEVQGPPPHPGQHTDDALADWGFTAEEVAKLRDAGAIR